MKVPEAIPAFYRDRVLGTQQTAEKTFADNAKNYLIIAAASGYISPRIRFIARMASEVSLNDRGRNLSCRRLSYEV